MEEKIRHLTSAYTVALKSPDLSTQNGAIIVGAGKRVIGSGCNTFPHGVKLLPERLTTRPDKYLYVEHAERNAIYDCVANGQSTDSAVMFCGWFACADCARGIIQSSIRLVVGHKKMFDDTPDRWKESISIAFQMFEEAGVETELIEHDFGLEPRLFNEQMWTP